MFSLPEIEERIRENRFDDLSLLKLNVDAYRIYLRYKFDPISVVSIGKIDPLPHQVEAFTKMMAMLRPQTGIDGRIRMLLADDVGLGKTIIIGLALKELILRKKINRVLIVCPSGLQIQWREELKDKFNEDFTIIRGNIEGNPYAEVDRAIISVDIGRNEEKRRLLLETAWDMVVFDEAHRLKPGNLRYDIGLEMSRRSAHLILATATPHDGKVENFLGLLRLIDLEMEDIKDSGDLRGFLDPLMIRRLKEDIVDFRGRRIFPRRSEPNTVEIGYSPEELNFYNSVEDYVRTYYQMAEDEGRTNVVLALYILHRRISSSLFAGVESLKKRKLKLLDHDLDLNSEELNSYFGYSDEGDEEKRERIEDKIIGAVASLTKEELRTELAHLEELIVMGESLLRSEQDRKYQQLLKLLAEIREDRPDDKIIIFTEFTDTLRYLEQNITKEGFVVTKIRGGMSPEEKKENARIFEKRANILLGTEAAGEGLNLQFANIAINYEIPWNPNRLEQRIGRVYRYGQKKQVYIYNLRTAFSIDEIVLDKILEKMANIRAVFGDSAVDVLGALISESDMLKIFKVSESGESAVDEVEKLFTEKIQILKEIENFFIKEKFNLVNVTWLNKDITHCINNFDIERFLLVYTEVCNEASSMPAQEGQYQLIIPGKNIIDNALCVEQQPQRFFDETVTGVFDSSRKGTYISLGHPAFDCALNDTITSNSISLIRYQEKGVLVTFIVRYYNGLGKEIYAEPFVVIKTDRETKEIDPLSIWDLKDFGSIKMHQINVNDYNYLIKEIVENPEVVLTNRLDATDNFVREKNKRDLETEHKFIRAEYNWKIKNLEIKKQLYLEKGQNYLLEPITSRISKFKKEFREYDAENRRAKNIEYKICGPVDVALLIPPTEHPFDETCSSRDFLRAQEAKREIELEGMKIVMQYEKDKGRLPSDVSAETYRGYDILSKSDREIRHIEVKSFARTNSIEISSNEWRAASQIREDYYLYVVQNIRTKPHLAVIRDPIVELSDYICKKPIYDYEMVLDELPLGINYLDRVDLN